jgi:uncharacterized protein YbjT (DUF2867 family)
MRAYCAKNDSTYQIFVERCIVIMVLIAGLNMLLITGASGRIARRAAALLAQQGYSLRLLTRHPQQAPAVDGAEVVRGDFAEPATLDGAFAEVSAALVISGSGKPGERAQLHRNAFEAAVRARVRHVVYLSLQGASPRSKYPYSRDHSLSEQYLAATGLPYTMLRNVFYLDMFSGEIRCRRGDSRSGQRDARRFRFPRGRSPNRGRSAGESARRHARCHRTGSAEPYRGGSSIFCADRPAASLPVGVRRIRTRAVEKAGRGFMARRSSRRVV